MRNRNLFAVGLLVITFLSVRAVDADVQKSTVDEQKSVEVTVYNNNRALIKDTRALSLKKGEGELRFMDVASLIQPETVHVKSLSHARQFQILEQNYEYDLIDRHKLLHKFVGKDLKLIQENMYQDVSYEVNATLLSYNNNTPIYQIEDEIYLGFNGYPVLPEIPENLIAKPTLMWQYAFEGRGKNDVEVSYLTQGLSWQADYILVLNKDDDKGDLSGWVTVNNRSGTAYHQASLKLVAGEVNQVQRADQRMRAQRVAAMDAYQEKSFVEQGFFEYHIYDLQRPTTLKDQQTKQINLLQAQGIAIEKEYRVQGQESYYTYAYRPQNNKVPVEVFVHFQNEKKNQLGMPLPKGTVRLYKKDHQDKIQFIGEDAVDHTPKDEKISLRVGKAFDVVAERKQTDYQKIRSQLHETAWEIKLRNRKEEDVVVTLHEPLYGSWDVIQSSHQFEKVDAFTIRFQVPVSKDEEVTIRYRIQVGLK